MSHDHNDGGLLASMKPRPRAAGTSRAAHAGQLERPSLFAGMEDDDVEDIASDRVSLLSSLTSRQGRHSRKTRQAHGQGNGLDTTRRRPPRRSGAPGASPWWSRALFAAMALGAVAVLYSFVQVVRQPHAMSARARALSSSVASDKASGTLRGTGTAPDFDALAPTAAGPLADTSPAALSVTTASPDTFQETAHMAAAPIEEVTPVPPPPTEKGPTHTAQKATKGADLTADLAPARNAALIARAQSDAARLNAPAAPVAPRTAPSREVKPRTSDDVALLEAMMKHASARRAPPSPAEDFQACDARQGAEAAVCKARACVQHPTAAQCHGDNP